MTTEQDLHFYRNPDQEGSVFAVDESSRDVRGDGLVEGYASTFERENSPVDWVPINPEFLGEEITEEEARDIHPKLFEKLDSSAS